MRRLLATHGLFRQLRKRGYTGVFANAYRPYFKTLLKGGLPGNRYSCSTLITYYGGLPFLDLDDLKQGQALYMDITSALLCSRGFKVPLLTPEEGAANLMRVSRGYDFCLFEYFLSDLAGHRGDSKEADRVVAVLQRFIAALASEQREGEEFLMMCSDHGNLEDLTSGNHTTNPVPALLVGDYSMRQEVAPGLRDLTDLLPSVLRILDG